MDSYDIMKDQHNEASYKLGDLSQKYLGTDKMPMDYDRRYIQSIKRWKDV